MSSDLIFGWQSPGDHRLLGPPTKYTQHFTAHSEFVTSNNAVESAITTLLNPLNDPSASLQE